MKATVEQIKGLPVSENTARLIACIRTIQEVAEEAYSALSSVYNEKVADVMFNEKFQGCYDGMEKALQEFVILSIEDNMSAKDMTEI